MTHWRELMPSPYLGAWDIPDGGSIVGKISKVEKKKISELQGAEKIVVSFSNLPKPLMANATNMKAISKSVGTDDFTQWNGKEIEMIKLKVTSVQDRELVDAIRVKRDKPKPRKSKMTPDILAAAVKAIKAGERNVEYVTDKYELTADELKQIQDAVPSK